MARSVHRLLLALVVLGLATPALGQTPKRGGVIRIAEREAVGLDPHLTIEFLTHSYVSLAYRHHDGFGLGPRLVYTWLEK